MNIKDVIGVQSERMGIQRAAPDVSHAVVALEQEITLEPVAAWQDAVLQHVGTYKP